MTREQEAERLARLTELAGELLTEVQALADGGGEQLVALTRRERFNRRMIQVMGAGIVLVVALTTALTVALVKVNSNADRINDLTRRLDIAQTETRRGAFCPLYQLLLQSKSAKGRAASDDPGAYDHSFEVIADGYKTLKCSDFIDGSPFTEAPKG